MKLTAKNASQIDLDGLNEEELRKLCRSLIDANADLKTQKERFKKLTKKHAKLHGVMLPQVATLVEALAERAGVSNEPSVQHAVEAIGAQTYTQWSGDITPIKAIPSDVTGRAEPKSGDAQMVLSAPLNEEISLIRSALLMGRIGGKDVSLVEKLLIKIEDVLQRAIADGFKARGLEFTPHNFEKAESKEGVETYTLDDLTNLLRDLDQHLDMATDFLRTDLRAAMYRATQSQIAKAAYIATMLTSEQAHKTSC